MPMKIILKKITDGEKVTAAMLLLAPHSMCSLCCIDNSKNMTHI